MTPARLPILNSLLLTPFALWVSENFAKYSQPWSAGTFEGSGRETSSCTISGRLAQPSDRLVPGLGNREAPG